MYGLSSSLTAGGSHDEPHHVHRRTRAHNLVRPELLWGVRVPGAWGGETPPLPARPVMRRRQFWVHATLVARLRA